MFCCQGCFGTRNRFVCSAPEAGTGSPRTPAEAAVAAGLAAGGRGERWIDIHCHLFNIIDLPALQFISKTRLTMPWPVKVPALLLLAPLVGGLNAMAITAEAELDELISHGTGRLMASNPNAPLGTELALRIVAGREVPEAAQVTGPLALGAIPYGRVRDRPTHVRPALPENGAELVREAANEEFPGRDPEQPATDAEIHSLSVRLDELANAGTLGVGTFMSWANGMARPRNLLTANLLSQFPDGADVLLTPSMVDYSRWLGIRSAAFDPVSTLNDQVAVMEEISRRRAADGRATKRAGLFTFVPFDPWRFVEDQMADRETSIERIERWIAGGQVVGVKLYPPMGFRPTGNARRGEDEFPSRLRDLAGARHPGDLIDGAMEALFAFCERAQVPIMAHCGNSNEAGHQYGLLAGPDGWEEALKAHPELRLNLAHFGGVFDLASPDADRRRLARRWAGRIVELMKTYPHLYADLGFGGQFLAEDCATGQECNLTSLFLRGLIDAHPVLTRRLMYGSDWVMVGMLEDADRYAELAMRSLARVFTGGGVEDFRWRNAARFLGLGAGDKARQRMAGFLDPIAQGLLGRFDPNAS